MLQEADDILEGLLTNASSPWVRGRILGSMDAVVSARIRLEGERAGSDPTRLFAVLERARARSLVELLHSRPLSDVHGSTDLRAGERRITALQMQLLRTTNRTNRQRLLDEIFRAEEALAPVTTELFARSRTSVRRPVTILRAAVRDALQRHKRDGDPVAVWREGRVVWLPPDQIPTAHESSETPSK
jgi:hypothetical protein